jgi:hypothetical protein
MKTLIALTAAMTTLLAGRVSAQGVPDQKYFTVDESQTVIEEITDRSADTGRPGGTGPVIPSPSQLPQPPTTPQLPHPPTTPQINPPINNTPTDNNAPAPVDHQQQFNNAINNINSTVGAIDNIVNLAQKIWNIIEANQPVVNITTNYANAVPFGTSHWTQLENWSKPATKNYSFSMKNGYGSEVVKVTYQVHYTYGGDYQGKGKFLTGVTIEPLNVVTAWGYKVTLVSEVPDSTVANVGTSADPIASMQVKLKWTAHTAIKDITSEAIYYVQGDGLLQEIGTPFKNGATIKEEKRAEAVSSRINGAKFN